jgi:nucleosome assembly protein 1-like 1
MEGKQNLKELLRAGGYDSEHHASYTQNLSEASKEVQRRVKALKKNQLEMFGVEQDFFQRVHELEREFQSRFNLLNEKRKAIVTGEHEPADEECELLLVHGLSSEELEKLENEAPVEGTPSKGIPGFWYHVLNNVGQISDIICEYDVPILKFLNDITTEITSEPNGFILSFHFDENPYFTNTVLKKYYDMKMSPDEENPFSYDGPTVIKSKGTLINWKEGKNVTKKVVKKKQKKGSGAGRYTTKTVDNESFFNFFDEALKEYSEDLSPEAEETLNNDFEIGQLLRDQILPHAVLYYTGEAADDAEDDYFDDEEDDENDGEHESDGEDE